MALLPRGPRVLLFLLALAAASLPGGPSATGRAGDGGGALDRGGAGPAPGFSLRFHGNGVAAPTLDRVVVSLDGPARPVDVGSGDFTVELWMKANPGENGSAFDCHPGNDAWINGNIVVDRDVFGAGDWGDWGLSLESGRLAFGAAGGNDGATACGASVLDDGSWHHVAATRRAADGLLAIWVDGAPDASADGPQGDISYRDGRPSDYPYDPYLVIGAEKHDAGAAYPSFSGWIDELRVSTVGRYGAPFTPPAAPFAADPSTAALYHFDEGTGNVVGDAAGAAGGPSDGERRFGGSPAGPEWSPETPFGLQFADGFEAGDLAAWSQTVP